MSSEVISRALVRDRKDRNTVLQNFTPPDWWENDVCEITPAGYWVEYEIKTSVSDFKRDTEKARDVGPGHWIERRYVATQERKHDVLAQTDRGPCRFFFVVPEGLLTGVPLPAWAGLIEVVDRGPGYSAYRYVTRITTEAPRRHSRADHAMKARMFEACYWRYHRLRA